MSLSKYDDFVVLSNDLSDTHGFTLTCFVHNEMYFLPPFLDHYRRLGVMRFIIIDDKSNDGTREYLAKQNDVMLLGTAGRFADKVVLLDVCDGVLDGQALHRVWRVLLMEKYCIGQWALHLDVDEFIVLPDGIKFTDLIAKLDKANAVCVTGVMLDVYPASVDDLRTQQHDEAINISAPWYFDGERHRRINWKRRLKDVHPGSRARLMETWGIRKKGKKKRVLGRPLRSPIQSYNCIKKPVLLKWQKGAYFLNSHKTTLKVSPDFFLPIMHFKFTGQIYKRISFAIKENVHTNGSQEYHDMKRLLGEMEKADGAFLYSKSRKVNNYTDFEDTGNAWGF